MLLAVIYFVTALTVRQFLSQCSGAVSKYFVYQQQTRVMLTAIFFVTAPTVVSYEINLHGRCHKMTLLWIQPCARAILLAAKHFVAAITVRQL